MHCNVFGTSQFTPGSMLLGRQIRETILLFKLATFVLKPYKSVTMNFIHYRVIAINCITWLLLLNTEFSFLRLYCRHMKTERVAEHSAIPHSADLITRIYLV